MAAPIASDIAFPIQYELIELDRIDRSGDKRAYSYPGARPVSRQQELAVAPILEVKPAGGDPWIALFYGVEGYDVPPALDRAVIALPDGRTFCVIKEGSGVIVRADDPTSTDEVESFPITHYLVIPEVELVVFADFTNLVAYGGEGVALEVPSTRP